MRTRAEGFEMRSIHEGLCGMDVGMSNPSDSTIKAHILGGLFHFVFGAPATAWPLSIMIHRIIPARSVLSDSTSKLPCAAFLLNHLDENPSRGVRKQSFTKGCAQE